MTPKYFAWLLRVGRVWCSFGIVIFGSLYFLVKRTSSVFSGLTPSPQSAVHLKRVDRAVPSDCKEFAGIHPAVG